MTHNAVAVFGLSWGDASVRAMTPVNSGDQIMEFKSGDVVMLKSGGCPLTVAAVDGENVDCVWLGEEGDLFRETLPAAVLEQALVAHDDDDEEELEDEDEDEEDEDEDSKVA